MAKSQWHRFYKARVAAPPAVLFALLSDMPNYGAGCLNPMRSERLRMLCHTPSKWAVSIMTGNLPSPEKTGGAP